MKFTFLKSAKLALLFSVAISQISCAENTTEPYFPGLSDITAVSETCSNYQGYSIKLIEKEGDQQFDLYKSPDCKDAKIYSLVLGVEANLAGIWQNFLVFDEGTDVNGHNLRLVSTVESEEVHTLAFEGDAPLFENKKIIYFVPSEEEATAKQCNALGIDFKDLKENS
ncbi:MAG TPA: hypothetical protein VLC79_14810, partial [Cellvibrio sp.]|nr:hypothetical protein [Cellvibrio sp.]